VSKERVFRMDDGWAQRRIPSTRKEIQKSYRRGPAFLKKNKWGDTAIFLKKRSFVG
jgi:hypothetical protein